MAPSDFTHSMMPLQSVKRRLLITPDWQLPHIAPKLAGMIAENDSLFCTQSTKLGSEANSLVEELKKHLSSLLHDKDRSPQSRWAAVVLVKATIEAGGHEVLQVTGPWIRDMIAILAKRDPPSTKKLCLVTLTRIFLLTQGHQSLVREVTTPVLPAFATACLRILSSKSDHGLALVAVQSLAEVMPHHPSSFRPFVAQIRTCILPLIAPTPATIRREPSDRPSSPSMDVANSSRRLYVLLSTCAPKKTENEEWVKSLRLVIEAAHSTADCVFRSLKEDRGSSFSSPQDMAAAASEPVQSGGDDPLGLPDWVGIDAGIERLEGLLHLLNAFVSTATHYTAVVPIAMIFSLASRMLALLAPANANHNSARINVDFRDEYKPLLLALPTIHALAINLLSSVTARLGSGGVSLYTSALHQGLHVVYVDSAHPAVRATVYDYIKQVIDMFGLSMPLSFKEEVSEWTRLCCGDLLSPAVTNNTSLSESQKSANEQTQTNGLKGSGPSVHQRHRHTSEAQLAAAELLPMLKTHLSENYLPPPMQAQIDRTAILTQHRETLLASVLHTPSQGARSILPFLARGYPDCNSTEALMRPRMPIVQQNPSPVRSLYNDDIDAGMQESSYAQIYSGNVDTENDHLHERRSTVEDSLRSDRQPFPAQSFASANVELSIGTENDTQRTEISLIEVPETQPLTVMSGNKRDHDATAAVDIPSPRSQNVVVDSMDHREDLPAPKRTRIDESQAAPAAESDAAAYDGTSESAVVADAMPTEVTVPVQAIKPAQPAANYSDSDDSSIHIDPTMDTEDEEEEEEEDTDS